MPTDDTEAAQRWQCTYCGHRHVGHEWRHPMSVPMHLLVDSMPMAVRMPEAVTFRGRPRIVEYRDLEEPVIAREKRLEKQVDTLIAMIAAADHIDHRELQ